MSKALSFDDIFAVMSAASVGNLAARVATPEHAQLDDTATRFAIALKILLDDLTLSNANGQRELAERGRLADRFELLSEAAREFSARPPTWLTSSPSWRAGLASSSVTCA